MVTVLGDKQMVSLHAWYCAFTRISFGPTLVSRGTRTGNVNDAASGYFSTLIPKTLSNDLVGGGLITAPSGLNVVLSASQILAGIGPPTGWVSE